MPRRCRCGKIGVPGALIKVRAIGGIPSSGKAALAECTGEFSLDFRVPRVSGDQTEICSDLKPDGANTIAPTVGHAG